jgi:hypothetical protein
MDGIIKQARRFVICYFCKVWTYIHTGSSRRHFDRLSAGLGGDWHDYFTLAPGTAQEHSPEVEMTTPAKRIPWYLWTFTAIWKLLAVIVEMTGRLVAMTLGIVLMIVGVIISLTVIGAIVGIPLAIIGLLLFLKGVF